MTKRTIGKIDRKFKVLSQALALVTLGTGMVSSGVISMAYADEVKPTKFTLVHLNDTHGHFWEDKYGQGGFAYIKTIINNIRKENDAKGIPTLVVHAGDWNTGVP